MDLNKSKKIFFIGIGGISMSSLAEILQANGKEVSGSNNIDNQMTDYLKNKGITVHIGHNKDNITNDLDLVVYTAAISEDNEEIQKAKELGIELIRREILLGEILKLYESPIAISGTHGKTTTSSMISEIFLEAKKNPTISVGGIIKNINSNTHVGGNEYFIAEACEYKDSFLALTPKVGIILNIDADHLDYFKDIDAIRASFKKFASAIPEDGTLIINNCIIGINEFIKDLKCNVITYGNDLADVKSKDITFINENETKFDVIIKDKTINNVVINVPGYHNVSNALAAIACSYIFDIDEESILKGLNKFCGAERRMELRGEFDGIKVYDDYAHHPTEIKASISAFKTMQKGKLITVFQSHTYTRTKALLSEFATSLADSDEVIITDIYAARETNDVNVYPEDLVNEIKPINSNVSYISKFEDIKNYLIKDAKSGDIIVIMGAGDVNIICDMLPIKK